MALLVAACFFMENLDGTIVVTAVPQMSALLGVLSSSTALVITSYLLMLAVLIPLSGWMTARFGPRLRVPLAIVVFTPRVAGLCAEHDPSRSRGASLAGRGRGDDGPRRADRRAGARPRRARSCA